MVADPKRNTIGTGIQTPPRRRLRTGRRPLNQAQERSPRHSPRSFPVKPRVVDAGLAWAGADDYVVAAEIEADYFQN